MRRLVMCAVVLVGLWTVEARAGELVGEAMYKHLVATAGTAGILSGVSETAAAVSWEGAGAAEFDGHLRRLETPDGPFYFVRAVTGEVYVLAPGEGDAYKGLDSAVGKKTKFKVLTSKVTAGGIDYGVVRLEAKPERLLLDRLFFIAIVVLLFLTMVGMGMTLTIQDFALVFKKPLGMIVGPVCQFGVMPVLAMLIGRAFGFYEAYPFIFLGLILISSSPGGVTSNLMTYFGKGDVALSVSLTAVCTVLALLFTPLLLQVFGSNIPEFSIPVMEVFKTMLVLVVVPLFVGMLVRWKAAGFARKAEKIFALIGLFALLFLIVVGIWSNLEKFADTDRYGFAFYLVVFLLTFAGMIVAGVVSKLCRVRNYQVRAISLETGLRNASLAMTIALLLQDQMGDFYSSMFFTSGIFGLWMYVAGAISIFLFPKILPLSAEEQEQHRAARESK